MKTKTLVSFIVLLGWLGSVTVAVAQGTAFTMLTITNPTPAVADYFGSSVAAVGTDRVLIGAHGDNTGATDAGASYLFSLAVQTPGAPSLSAAYTSTNTVCIGWPVSETSWVLQATTNLVTTGSVWNAYSYVTNGTNCLYIESPPTGTKFYRLHTP